MRDIIDVRSKPQPPARKFLILPEDQTPHAALTWESTAQKRVRLQLWRSAVMKTFGEQARAIRVAWLLSSLFHAERGYAYPTDKYIAKETGVPIKRVQDALAALDDGGAICRVHRVVGENKTQRHIYAARTLIPQHGGTVATPAVGDGRYPRKLWVQTKKDKRHISPTAALARSAAEQRDRRRNGEAGTHQGENPSALNQLPPARPCGHGCSPAPVNFPDLKRTDPSTTPVDPFADDPPPSPYSNRVDLWQAWLDRHPEQLKRFLQ